MAAAKGRFEVRGVLGQGGGGVVHRGWDHEQRCEIAIKSLAPPYAPEAALRFAREAEALVRLRHPHVVRAIACEAGPPPRLIMELLPEGSLEDRLRAEGPQPIGRVVRWGQVLADTLTFVHARGFVHRDLKPANVLLDAGQLKLADFGLTRGETADTVTATGEVLGTPAYLAPEQALAQAIGPHTDIYGLGALLYALLTGRPPVSGPSSLELLKRVAQGAITPPSQLRTGLPAWLERVVLRCLATDPEDRFPSMEALANELRAAKSARFSRPTMLRTLLGVAGLALLGLGLLTFVWSRRGSPDVSLDLIGAPQPDPFAETRAGLRRASSESPADLRRALREVALSRVASEPELWPLRARLYRQAGLPRLARELVRKALQRAPRDAALLELAAEFRFDPAASQKGPPAPDLRKVWTKHLGERATRPANPDAVFASELLPREELVALKSLALQGEFADLERRVLQALPDVETRVQHAWRAANVFEALRLKAWARFALEPWAQRDLRCALRLTRYATTREDLDRLLRPWRGEADRIDLVLTELEWLAKRPESQITDAVLLANQLRGRDLSDEQQARWLTLCMRLGEELSEFKVAEGELTTALGLDISLATRLELWAELLLTRWAGEDYVGVLEACRGLLDLRPLHGGVLLRVMRALEARGDFGGAATLASGLALSPQRPLRVRGEAAELLIGLAQSDRPTFVAGIEPPTWSWLVAQAHALNTLRPKDRQAAGFNYLCRFALDHALHETLVELTDYGRSAYPSRQIELAHLTLTMLEQRQGQAAVDDYLEGLGPALREGVGVAELARRLQDEVSAGREVPPDDAKQLEVCLQRHSDSDDPALTLFLAKAVVYNGDRVRGEALIRKVQRLAAGDSHLLSELKRLAEIAGVELR